MLPWEAIRLVTNSVATARGSRFAPRYSATAAAAPVEVAPSPPPPRVVRDELRERMLLLREGCEDGDRRACVRLGIPSAGCLFEPPADQR